MLAITTPSSPPLTPLASGEGCVPVNVDTASASTASDLTPHPAGTDRPTTMPSPQVQASGATVPIPPAPPFRPVRPPPPPAPVRPPAAPPPLARAMAAPLPAAAKAAVASGPGAPSHSAQQWMPTVSPSPAGTASTPPNNAHLQFWYPLHTPAWMERHGLTNGPMTSWMQRQANIRAWCELQRCDDATIARLLRLTPWQHNF
eukprot:2704476-Heterocapsa_arctica.AAC.1